MNNLRKIYPLIMIIIFSLVIFYYYKNNLDEFKNFKNINFFFFLKIIILSMIYLISEGLILKNIVNFLNKKISLIESFFVMNFTYFCNTFVQFTGLGYRVYYLKKNKNIKVSEILKSSLDTIACEIFIFSLIGIFSLFYIDLNSSAINISLVLYFVFLFFLFLSIIYLVFLPYISLSLNKILNYLNFYKLDKILIFFSKKIELKNKFYINQCIVFCFQYAILFTIFFLILKNLKVENYLYLSLLTTSLVDFSFLMAFTPYSVGVTEFITFFGTKDASLSFGEVILLVNIFRISMLIIYFILGPSFVIFKMVIKKNGM